MDNVCYNSTGNILLLHNNTIITNVNGPHVASAYNMVIFLISAVIKLHGQVIRVISHIHGYMNVGSYAKVVSRC